jgi:hypothetical protein
VDLLRLPTIRIATGLIVQLRVTVIARVIGVDQIASQPLHWVVMIHRDTLLFSDSEADFDACIRDRVSRWKRTGCIHRQAAWSYLPFPYSFSALAPRLSSTKTSGPKRRTAITNFAGNPGAIHSHCPSLRIVRIKGRSPLSALSRNFTRLGIRTLQNANRPDDPPV